MAKCVLVVELKLSNEHESKQTQLKNIHKIEEKVMIACSQYISNVINSAPRKIRYDLSKNNPCEIDTNSQRWLKRRLLINEQAQINIPIFARWMQELSEF